MEFMSLLPGILSSVKNIYENTGKLRNYMKIKYYKNYNINKKYYLDEINRIIDIIKNNENISNKDKFYFEIEKINNILTNSKFIFNTLNYYKLNEEIKYNYNEHILDNTNNIHFIDIKKYIKNELLDFFEQLHINLDIKIDIDKNPINNENKKIYIHIELTNKDNINDLFNDMLQRKNSERNKINDNIEFSLEQLSSISDRIKAKSGVIIAYDDPKHKFMIINNINENDIEKIKILKEIKYLLIDKYVINYGKFNLLANLLYYNNKTTKNSYYYTYIFTVKNELSKDDKINEIFNQWKCDKRCFIMAHLYPNI